MTTQEVPVKETTCKYEYTPDMRIGWQHTWSIVGELGGLHVWIRESPSSDREYGAYGGFEIHHRHKTHGCACKNEDCWLLKGTCWHDGSSLDATEYWIPMWKRQPHNHEAFFSALRSRYDSIFTEEDEMAAIETNEYEETS